MDNYCELVLFNDIKMWITINDNKKRKKRREWKYILKGKQFHKET